MTSSGKGATALLTVVSCFARWQQGSWVKDDAFTHTFYLSLSEHVKDKLSWTVRTVDLPLSFEALVELAIKVDNRMQEQEQLCKTTGGETHWDLRQHYATVSLVCLRSPRLSH